MLTGLQRGTLSGSDGSDEYYVQILFIMVGGEMVVCGYIRMIMKHEQGCSQCLLGMITLMF